jgi:hypothetical protein
MWELNQQALQVPVQVVLSDTCRLTYVSLRPRRVLELKSLGSGMRGIRHGNCGKMATLDALPVVQDITFGIIKYQPHVNWASVAPLMGVLSRLRRPQTSAT